MTSAPAVVHTQTLPVLDLAATQLSGTPGVDASGDFYDVFPIEVPAAGPGDAGTTWWCVVMGDVCGKGIAAASTAASVRHAAHTVAAGAVTLSTPDPALLLHRLHDVLMSATGRRFVTAVAAVLRPDGRGGLVGRLASAGHEPALIRRSWGAVDVVAATGTLLGLVARQLSPTVDVEVGAGDVLVVFTDGVTDARAGPGGECFGLDRVVATLAVCDSPVRAVVEAVTTSTLAYRGAFLGDDLAILAVSPRT